MEAQLGQIGWLGFIVFTIVIGSLSCIILAAILGKPWKPKVTVTFLGTIFVLLSAVIATFWLGGTVLGAFIP